MRAGLVRVGGGLLGDHEAAGLELDAPHSVLSRQHLLRRTLLLASRLCALGIVIDIGNRVLRARSSSVDGGGSGDSGLDCERDARALPIADLLAGRWNAVAGLECEFGRASRGHPRHLGHSETRPASVLSLSALIGPRRSRLGRHAHYPRLDLFHLCAQEMSSEQWTNWHTDDEMTSSISNGRRVSSELLNTKNAPSSLGSLPRPPIITLFTFHSPAVYCALSFCSSRSLSCRSLQVPCAAQFFDFTY